MEQGRQDSTFRAKTSADSLAAIKEIHAQMGVTTKTDGGRSGHEDKEDIAVYMATRAKPLRQVVMAGGGVDEVGIALHMHAEHCEHTQKKASFQCFLDYINDGGTHRQTALYWAVYLQRPLAVIKLLLNAGIDITVKTMSGKRAHQARGRKIPGVSPGIDPDTPS